MTILPRLSDLWKKDRERVYDVSSSVIDAINTQKRSTVRELDKETLRLAYQQLSKNFDQFYGGFGSAPKFPTPHNIIFLLRYWKQSGETRALEMAEKTLDSMARGGIYDHIGFGFHRYSTDGRWLVPHFEKILYDNALLAYAYVEAYQATSKEKYAETAREIFAYVRRNMTSPEGGFYSAEDADSEGVEGKFYVWDLEEIRQVLGEKEAEFFCQVYGITDKGNFDGKNIPNLIDASLEDRAIEKSLDLNELKNRLKSLREKLYEYREKRIHPHKDDKILTSWNGMMIAALAKGGRVLEDEKMIVTAEKAVSFILRKLRRDDGRLLARYRKGDAAFPGYLDDYAFLIWGLLELYEATFDSSYLEQALKLNIQMIQLFWDPQDGGFYFYGTDGEKLISRPKEIYDGATPSGNSVAALNMLKLARMTGKEDLAERVQILFSAFAGEVSGYPVAHTYLMCALLFALKGSREIVIAGNPKSNTTKAMVQMVNSLYLPDTVIIFHPEGEEGKKVSQLAPMVEDMHTIEKGKATAFVFENYACNAPTTDLKKLTEVLKHR